MSDDKLQTGSETKDETDLEKSIEIPPTFANITNVTAAGEVARISFGEFYGNAGPKYHTSVVLPTRAALEFAKLIQQVVGEHQKRMEMEAQASTPKGTLN